MKKFSVDYFFDGNGTVVIEAENEEQARNKFISGEDWQGEEQEWGENYVPESITEKE